MRRLLSEFVEPEELECEFDEVFGWFSIIPAAFSVERNGDGIWDTIVHVYEVESTSQISKDRLSSYGWLADAEGPLITLHIIDRYGNEHVLENNELECFSACEHFPAEYTDEMLRSVRAVEKLPKSKRTAKWKAAYDALREMGIEI